jgi:hypothetical protein
MDLEDLNKENRDGLDSTIEEKLMGNLQWSLLFFMFNNLLSARKDSKLDKEFFKGWKKFASENLVAKDLETINAVLNSPKNMFNSLLRNKNETLESTEIYQEKYNKIMKRIEKFYFNSIKSQNADEEE